MKEGQRTGGGRAGKSDLVALPFTGQDAEVTAPRMRLEALADGALNANAPTLADLWLAPNLELVAKASAGAAILEDFPKLRAWFETFQARPSMVKTRVAERHEAERAAHA